MMKALKSWILMSCLLLAISCVSAQQITFFDLEGDARLYVDYDDMGFFFTMEGVPLGFVIQEGSTELMYGMNGQFLAWIEKGIIYDQKGYILGSKKDALFHVFYRPEPLKGVKRMITHRPLPGLAPMKPFFQIENSQFGLMDIMLRGRR